MKGDSTRNRRKRGGTTSLLSKTHPLPLLKGGCENYFKSARKGKGAQEEEYHVEKRKKLHTPEAGTRKQSIRQKHSSKPALSTSTPSHEGLGKGYRG